jgi:hypothetical protein
MDNTLEYQTSSSESILQINQNLEVLFCYQLSQGLKESCFDRFANFSSIHHMQLDYHGAREEGMPSPFLPFHQAHS